MENRIGEILTETGDFIIVKRATSWRGTFDGWVYDLYKKSDPDFWFYCWSEERMLAITDLVIAL